MLQACAGIPTRTAPLDPRTQLWSYENKYERTGGLEITLPIIGGGLAAGGSGSYCHALVRILDGKVAGVTYAATMTTCSAETAYAPRSSAAACGSSRNRATRAEVGELAAGRLAGGGQVSRRRPVRDRRSPQPEAYRGSVAARAAATERLRDRPGNVAAGASFFSCTTKRNDSDGPPLTGHS